eukprot:TRINITY_DN4173_c0_g1_i2.p1 TRINITY_DN4173_c0_g1~~TRINITY_DN4173_c0_g1_i2.p1  ORF type:complete len:852 (+),score=153.02 TRINITY_DN4173_c0_g1_i2:31-2586(+)
MPGPKGDVNGWMARNGFDGGTGGFQQGVAMPATQEDLNAELRAFREALTEELRIFCGRLRIDLNNDIYVIIENCKLQHTQLSSTFFSQRHDSKDQPSSTNGSQRYVSKDLFGSTNGSQRHMSKDQFGSTNGSQRHMSKDRFGSTNGSQRHMSKDLFGSTNGSQRHMSKDLFGSTNGSQRHMSKDRFGSRNSSQCHMSKDSDVVSDAHRNTSPEFRALWQSAHPQSTADLHSLRRTSTAPVATEYLLAPSRARQATGFSDMPSEDDGRKASKMPPTDFASWPVHQPSMPDPTSWSKSHDSRSKSHDIIEEDYSEAEDCIVFFDEGIRKHVPAAGKPFSKNSGEAWAEDTRIDKTELVIEATSNSKTSEVTKTETVEDKDPVRKLRSRKMSFKAPIVLDMISAEENPGWLANLVNSDYFDYIVATILCLNALFIGIQVEFMAHHTSPEPPVVFRVLDWLFTLAFLVELLMRLGAFRTRFFTMQGWQWHWFDLFIVTFGLADEITTNLFSGSELEGVIEKLGVLRLLRLGRVIRLVRMVRLIPALKSMVYLISASMTSFFWTGVLLLILMYVVAIYFTELATDLKHENSYRYTSLEHWSSLGASVLSLFQAITGGDDWNNFVSGLPNETYKVNVIILALYVAFATLVMLNLVTGVFVEGAQRIAREERDQELIKYVRRLYKVCETNKDGEVSWDEFEGSLSTKAMQDFLKAFEMDSNKARDIFLVLDTDKSGAVGLEEFVAAATSLNTPVKNADTEILRYAMNESFETLTARVASLEATIRGSQDEKHSTPELGSSSREQTPSFLAPVHNRIGSIARMRNHVDQKKVYHGKVFTHAAPPAPHADAMTSLDEEEV